MNEKGYVFSHVVELCLIMALGRIEPLSSGRDEKQANEVCKLKYFKLHTPGGIFRLFSFQMHLIQVMSLEAIYQISAVPSGSRKGL